MALIQYNYCRFCEAEKQHTNGKCNDCCEREYHEAIAAWHAKTTDEMLLDLHKRLQRLEAGLLRYE